MYQYFKEGSWADKFYAHKKILRKGKAFEDGKDKWCKQPERKYMLTTCRLYDFTCMRAIDLLYINSERATKGTVRTH